MLLLHICTGSGNDRCTIDPVMIPHGQTVRPWSVIQQDAAVKTCAKAEVKLGVVISDTPAAQPSSILHFVFF